jgi:hypothetical protein
MMNDINYRGESISYSGGSGGATHTRTGGFDSERCIWKQLTADVCVPLGLMQRRPAKVQLVKLLHN